MLQVMKQENTDLHQQACQLPEIISAFKEMWHINPTTLPPNASPQTRLPPPDTMSKLHPAAMDECPGLTENFMEHKYFLIKYWESNPQHFIPSCQLEFETPWHEWMPPAHTEYRQSYHLSPSTQEKKSRCPAPTIPFITSPDPREFSGLREHSTWGCNKTVQISDSFWPHKTGGSTFCSSNSSNSIIQGFLSLTPWQPLRRCLAIPNS